MSRKSKTGTSVWAIRRKRKWKLICRFLRDLPCWLYVTIIILVFAWLAWPLGSALWAKIIKPINIPSADLGSFGDLFGSLNVLVAAFAFIGFLYALHLQRKDLRLQRMEMRQSRMEMELQTAQFKEQTNILRQQNEDNKRQYQLQEFTQHLYHRIAVMRELLGEVRFELLEENGNGIHSYKGADAINELCARLYEIAITIFPDKQTQLLPLKPGYTALMCEKFYTAFEYTSAVFVNFCFIVNEICEKFRNDEICKKQYARIVLSSVNINCLSYIYAFHDTYFGCKYLEELANDIEIAPVSSVGTYTRERRVALRNLMESIAEFIKSQKTESFSSETLIDIVIESTLKWRKCQGLANVKLKRVDDSHQQWQHDKTKDELISGDNSAPGHDSPFVNLESMLSSSGAMLGDPVQLKMNVDSRPPEVSAGNTDAAPMICYAPLAVQFTLD